MIKSLRDKISLDIITYGFQVIGVQAESGHQSFKPTFSYTIGLSERFGAEFIVVGLRADIAHAFFWSIVKEHLEPNGKVELNTKLYDLSEGLPTMFRVCDSEKIQLWAYQAFGYYGKDDVPFIQLVMPDKNGIFPEEEGFDHAYMDDRQKLLYTL